MILHLCLGSILQLLVIQLISIGSHNLQQLPVSDCNNLQSYYYLKFRHYTYGAYALIGFDIFIFISTHSLFAIKYWILSHQLAQSPNLSSLRKIAKAQYIIVSLVSIVGCVLSSLTFTLTLNKLMLLRFAGCLFELCLLSTTVIIANALYRMQGRRYRSEFSLSILSGSLLLIAYLFSDLAAGMFFVVDTQY